MNDVNLIGGDAKDRKRVLEQHAAYLDANSKFDIGALRGIWSEAPAATFFNLNGHTYRGREHWFRLWEYYSERIETGYWTPSEMGGVVGADVAVVWCHRKTRIKWIGEESRAAGAMHEDKEFRSRSTMVFHKEGGDWRVVHVHFSDMSESERPGGI